MDSTFPNDKAIRLKGKVFVPFISQEEISDRVREMAAEVEREFASQAPVFLILLKGAFIFASDLLRHLSFESRLEFVRARSYDGTRSTGEIKYWGLEELEITGETVVILEDIIDTGITMEDLLGRLRKKEPRRIEIVSLLMKPDVFKGKFRPWLVGFDIPPAFVIGYGLDIDERGRHLKELYRVSEML